MMLGASIAALPDIGFDAISTLAEDTLHPEKDIGFSTVLVCILQTLICVVTVYFAALAGTTMAAFPTPTPRSSISDTGSEDRRCSRSSRLCCW